MYNFAWNRSHVGRAKIKPVTLAFGDGAATIAYSYDGIYWNSCRTDAITTRANHGCWNGYIWVAVGTGGNWVATSYDGVTWTGQDYSIFNEGYYVAWNGTMFVAAGTGENTLATSTDGFNWSAVSNSVFSTSANYVEWTGNVWCAVGSGTNTSATSSDGTTWTATTQQFMVTDVSSVIWDITSTTTASSGNAAAAFDGKTAAITTSPTEWRSGTASYNSDGTASSLYSTALDTGSTIYGEYLTITPAESTILNYYVLHFSISGNLYEIPSAWYVLGAATTSPTTWSVIDQFTFTKTVPPTYGSRGYYACPVAVSTTTAAATYRIVFTNTFATGTAASYVRVMEADLFYASATTTTIDRKIRPFLTPNGVMYPIRLGSYNYLVYTDRTNTLVKTNTFGLSYYNCDISGLDIYANSGLTRGFAYDGQNCVAISSGGKMSYTPDFGKTWSDIVSPTYANTDLYAIAHNGTFFIMGGNQYVAVITNGNTLSYVSSYSLSTLSATTVDSSSISLSWGGDSTTVQLIWNLTGGSTYSTATDSNQTYGNTITATTINGLYSNARYYFKITPVSDYGEYGTAIYDISTVTLASLTQFATSTIIYDTSAQIYVDGSYSYIDISYGRAAAARYYKTGYIDISNITPNTYYTATPTIYNLVEVSTTLDEKSVTFITNPKISLSSTTIDASTVFISTTNDTAQYSTATLWWNTTGTFSATTDSSYSYTNNYYLSGLSYNTNYYFRAEPIGTTGSTGVNAYTNVTTAAMLSTFQILIYDTSAQIVYDGSFTYLDISYAAAATAATTTLRYYLAPSTTKLDISNLTPDTSYNFRSVVYNRASSRYAGQNIFAYTLPKVSQITAAVDQYKTSSTYITLTFTGNYTSLNLWWNLSGGTYAATDASATGITGTTYTIYDLSQNTTYYIRTIPVGSQGAYGYARDISVNTSFGISFVFLNAFYGAAAGSYPMYLTYSTATAYDISTISLNWGGYYDNVIVQYDTSSGFVSPTTQTFFNIDNATVGGLSYNTTYYFKTTPSALGSGNTGNSITTNATTNPVLTSYSLYIYDTSAQIVYDGSLTYIDISYVSTSGGETTTTRRYYGAPGITTDISNLVPDTSYVFSSVYYGRAGANFAGQTISAYSLPKVATFTATETAFTAAKLEWSGGKYTAMNLYLDTSAAYSTIAATVYGNTYTATNLTTDTVYYFRAQPVGAAGATGYILDISLNLYSVYLTSLTAATYDSSSIYVYYVGSFDTLTTICDTSSVATAAATTTTVSRGTEQSLLSSLSANTIYYFRSTPATTSGINGTAFTATATTAPTLTRFQLSIYDTSAQIVIDGSLSYIDISYVSGAGDGTDAIAARYYDTPTTISITDLTPDTSYIFQSTIYNKSSTSFAGTNTTQYTLPKVTAFSGTESSFTSAQLTWSGGKYTAMNLYWDTSAAYSTIAATVYGNTYTATGLTTDTIYYFRAQPVGAIGASGYALDISINIYSVYFTSFSATARDSSSISLTFAGFYDSGSIVRDISSGFSTTPVYTTVSSTDTTETATNLEANTKYYFAATPQTSSGIAGTVFYADATTAATLTQFYISAIYDTSAQVVYDGSLSYVDISAAGSIVRASGAPATYTIENIYPNTYYSVYITYYNSAAASQTSDPAQFITLPRASDLGATQYDLSAATISWSAFSTDYTAVNLYWGTSAGATDISSLYVVGGNTYVAPNLVTNTTYYFTLEPVGTEGARGNTTSVQIYIYNAALTTFTATAANSSTINLAWTGDYYTVDISSTTAATTTYDTSSARIENLAANTTYYFTATPYTPARISGASTPAQATTAAKLTQYYISAVYDTSAQIIYDGSLSYVDISAGGQTAATYITSGIYDLSALTPDTYYKIQIIYYNSAGAFDISAATILTLPRAADLTATQTGLYTADVTWSGNYTTANLYWGTTAAATDSSAIGITGGTYSITFTLTQDTVYYFTLEPVGAEGAIGTTLTTETYMYDDTLITFTASARDSSSIELTWTGNYDQLDISYNNTIDSYYDPSINSALIENLEANTKYYFAATPYTPLDLAGTTLTTETTTDATLTAFYVAAIYDTSAQIYYDGSLSYVDISAGTSIVRRSTTPPATYTIENLTPNTYYSVYITYYNSAAVATATTDPTTILTLPRAQNFAAAQYDLSSVQLTWSGNYTATNLYWGTAAGATDISSLYVAGNTYLVTGLATNTTYYFTVAPVGTEGSTGYSVATNIYIYNSVLTTFSATAQDSSSIALTWSGDYNTVYVSGSGGAAAATYDSSTALIENLEANTTYYFTATSYTPGGIAGASTTAQATTAATLTQFYATAIYDTSAQIVYDGSLAYVDISSIISIVRSTATTPATYTIENLTPNTYYSVYITYYNSSGNSITSSPSTILTLPRATNFAAAQYDLSSAQLTWDGNFNATNLYWSTAEGATDISFLYVAGNIYIAQNLATNTTYYFTLAPLGTESAIGNQITTNIYIYNAAITTFSATAQDSSSIALTWSGDYNTVYVSGSGGAAAATYDSSTALIENLAANTTYYFSATPYTPAGISGVTSTTYTTTKATLTQFYIAAIYDTSAQIYYDGSLAYVDIAATGSSERISATPPQTYTIENLTPNTYYSIELTYYNISDISYNATAQTILTLPRATNFAAAQYDLSAATLTWDGDYTAINLYWGNAEGAIDISSLYMAGNTYLATELATNTTYYFTLQPIGTEGATGNQTTANIYVYNAALSTFSAVARDASSIELTWTGDYNTVYVSGSGGTAAATYDSSSASIENLAANTTYYFTATPYTPGGIAGASSSAETTTAATLTQFYAAAIYDTSAQIVYDGSLSYVDISAAGATTRINATPPQTYTIENLASNTYYSIELTYYNAADVSSGTSILELTTL